MKNIGKLLTLAVALLCSSTSVLAMRPGSGRKAMLQIQKQLRASKNNPAQLNIIRSNQAYQNLTDKQKRTIELTAGTGTGAAPKMASTSLIPVPTNVPADIAALHAHLNLILANAQKGFADAAAAMPVINNFDQIKIDIANAGITDPSFNNIFTNNTEKVERLLVDEAATPLLEAISAVTNDVSKSALAQAPIDLNLIANALNEIRAGGGDDQRVFDWIKARLKLIDTTPLVTAAHSIRDLVYLGFTDAARNNSMASIYNQFQTANVVHAVANIASGSADKDTAITAVKAETADLVTNKLIDPTLKAQIDDYADRTIGTNAGDVANAIRGTAPVLPHSQAMVQEHKDLLDAYETLIQAYANFANVTEIAPLVKTTPPTNYIFEPNNTAPNDLDTVGPITQLNNGFNNLP